MTRAVRGPTPADSKSSVVTTRSGSAQSDASPPSSTTVVHHPRARAMAVSVWTIGDRPTTTRSGPRGSGSMKIFSAPSLWHDIGTSTVSSSPSPARSSGEPRNTSRGVPSARADSASRTTTGSAQAPPTQPRTSPEAVMTAREPVLPDDGARRHTTVARAKCSPFSASSRATSSASAMSVPRQRREPGNVLPGVDGLPHPAGEHRHVDVADPEVGDGVDDGVDEGGRAADAGALADPLGPDRVVGTGGDDLVELPVGRLPGRGQEVVHVVGADAVPV